MITLQRKQSGASKKLIYLALDLFGLLEYIIMEQLCYLTWAGSLRVNRLAFRASIRQDNIERRGAQAFYNKIFLAEKE